MKNNWEEVRKKFKGKLIGKMKMQKLVCTTLAEFPKDIIDFVTQNVWFASSFNKAWGYAFRGDDLSGQFLIFLSDELFYEPEVNQQYEVAHEIGHVILRHKNLVMMVQSKVEIKRQEKEADQFARHYLKFVE